MYDLPSFNDIMNNIINNSMPGNADLDDNRYFQRNAEENEKLNAWKISTEPTVNNLRRVIWATVSVVLAMLGSAAAYLITSHISK